MIGSLEPIVQKDIADCAIASLAMIAGVPYRMVSELAIRSCAAPHKNGLWETQIKKLGRALGVTFKRVSAADDVTGLIVVVRGSSKTSECHIAALFQGVVINPADGMLWDFDTYLATGGWSVATIYERIR